MCVFECSNKLRYSGIDIVYVGVKLLYKHDRTPLYKHDRTPQGFLKERILAPSPNDSWEMSVSVIWQNDLAFRMNAASLEVLEEVLLSLLIKEPDVKRGKRIRRSRWPRTTKRVLSRNGFAFGCHNAVYLREREREKTIKKHKRHHN